MDDWKNLVPETRSGKKIHTLGRSAEHTLWENRSLLLHLIKNAGSLTRKELTAASGLPPATVSSSLNDLMQMKLVEEAGSAARVRSRRAMRFRLVNRYCTFVINFGASSMSVVAYDIQMNPLFSSTRECNALEDLGAACDMAAAELALAQTGIADLQVLGASVSVEGGIFRILNRQYQLFHPGKGTYFDLAQELSSRIGIFVTVNRMSNFSAYYLWDRHHRDGPGTLIALCIGECVEYGVVVNGSILNGENGMGGVLGRMVPSGRGEEDGMTLNEQIAPSALLRRTAKLLPIYPSSPLSAHQSDLSIRHIMQAYESGDPLATRIFDECSHLCGRLVAWLVQLLDPGVIVLVGDIPCSGAFLRKVGTSAASILRAGVSISGVGPASVVHVSGLRGEFTLVGPGQYPHRQDSPAMLGAADYLFDEVLGSSAFWESTCPS